jgi:hypothetical protein
MLFFNNPFRNQIPMNMMNSALFRSYDLSSSSMDSDDGRDDRENSNNNQQSSSANNPRVRESAVYSCFQRLFGRYFPAVTFVSLLLIFATAAMIASQIPSALHAHSDQPRPLPPATPPTAGTVPGADSPVNPATPNLPPTARITPSHPHHTNGPDFSIFFYTFLFYFIILMLRNCVRTYYASRNLLPFTRGDLNTTQADGIINSFFSHMDMGNRMTPATMEALRARLRLGLMNRDFNGNDYEMLQQLDSPQNRGVSQNAIDRLPLHTITSEHTSLPLATAENDGGTGSNRGDNASGDLGSCPICLEPYAVGDEVRTVMCIHGFHKRCIDTWLRYNKTCPVCKSIAVEEL